IHLLPLPGSPGWGGDLGDVLDHARREAEVLVQGGAHGIVVENYGDAPFRIGRVESETVSAMTLAVRAVQDVSPLPVGVNMLRNDAGSALAVAAVTGAGFIRVNVHYGVMAAHEGIVQGEAFDTLRRREYLGADIKILADVLVKHAAPLGQTDLGLMARETATRGMADGLIISGPATGLPTSATDLAAVREKMPDGFILVGSGVTESNARDLLAIADGAIVGTSLKKDGVITNPLDLQRVQAMAAVFGEFS
ncbi:MAG: BtpA/SgcQ family protein, partial [Chloroflexi bacterium]|nr:BtpA/SgcQ family protein [Chloroflexota bacterium]